MFPALPSVRVTAALLALAAASPALAQYRDRPPEPWPADEADEDPTGQPPPPPSGAPERRDEARPAPPAYPPSYPPPAYRPRRPAYRSPRYAPPPPTYGPGRYQPARYFYPHIEVALRGGVASPGGSAMDGVLMRDLFGTQATLGLDVGLRATPRLYMGLFAEGGVGMAGDLMIGNGGAASGRIGAALHYHFAPGAPLDPWIGYGVAASGATVSTDTPLGTEEHSFSGIEFAKLMAGVDLPLGGNATLGLFAEWTTGVFSEAETRLDGVVVDSGTVGTTATHSWFTIGPRLKF